uniref:Uncharacterized protein n=1 Tax=Timspurckia oligopyrenoides TaxID=708627 RepID=A0A7S0ZAQ8_9RHOD
MTGMEMWGKNEERDGIVGHKRMRDSNAFDGGFERGHVNPRGGRFHRGGANRGRGFWRRGSSAGGGGQRQEQNYIAVMKKSEDLHQHEQQPRKNARFNRDAGGSDEEDRAI